MLTEKQSPSTLRRWATSWEGSPDMGMVLDDRLENHLRGIADLPLRDTQQRSLRKSRPAFALKRPKKRRRRELAGCKGSKAEVAA